MEKGSIDISGLRVNNAKTSDKVLIARKTGNAYKWRVLDFDKIAADVAYSISRQEIYVETNLTLDDVCQNGSTTSRSITTGGLTSNGRILGKAELSISNYASIGGYIEMGDYTASDHFALTTDFSGTGWKGTYAGDFNIRNLVVREAARFRELIIDQLSIIAGSDLLSVARGKIDTVDSGANTITLEDPNDRNTTRFVANDFFWVKAIDIDNNVFKDLKGQITNVSGVTLTLDTTVVGGTHEGGTTDISSLAQGDVIVQRGHPTDSTRQNLIYRTVSDSDAPVEKHFTGIDSLAAFDNQDNLKSVYGNLENLNSTVFGDLSGKYGLYSKDVYLKGKLAVTEPNDTSVRVEVDPSKNSPSTGTVLDSGTLSTSTTSDTTEELNPSFASGQPEAYNNFAVKVTITGYSMTPRYNAKVYIEAYSDSAASWQTLEDALLWIGSKGGDFTGYTVAFIDSDYSDFRIKIVHKYGNTSGTVTFDWQIYEGTVLMNDNGIYIRTSEWTYEKIGTGESSVGYVDEGAGGDEAVEWDDIENNPFNTNSVTLGDGTASDISFIFNDGTNRIFKWDDTNGRFDLNNAINIQGNIKSSGVLQVDGTDTSYIFDKLAIGHSNIVTERLEIAGNTLITRLESELTDNSVLNSPDLILRGFYDDDATAGSITPASIEWRFRSISYYNSSDGDQELQILNDGFTTMLSIMGNGNANFVNGTLSEQGSRVYSPNNPMGFLDIPETPSSWSFDKFLKTDPASGIVIFTDVNLGDLNNVSTASPGADQLLQHNGTNWVNIDQNSLPFDNYQQWYLFIDGTQQATIGSGGKVELLSGTNISFSWNDTGNKLTVDATDTDTRANISNGVTLVTSNVTDINFDTNIAATDDGDGSVTVTVPNDLTVLSSHQISELSDFDSGAPTSGDIVEYDGSQYTHTAKGVIPLSSFQDDLEYDNYGQWYLWVDGVNQATIGGSGKAEFIGGTNISLSFNATGNKTTINVSSSDITDLSGHSVTELSNITDAGSGSIITSAERNNLHTHSNKSVLDGILSSDVTDWNSAHDHSVTGGNPHGTTISELNSLFSAGVIQIVSATYPTSGTGLELAYSSANAAGVVRAYDEDTSSYMGLDLEGSPIELKGGNVNVTDGTLSEQGDRVYSANNVPNLDTITTSGSVSNNNMFIKRDNGARFTVQSNNGNSSDDYPAELYLKEDEQYDHGFLLRYHGSSNYAVISTVDSGTEKVHIWMDRTNQNTEFRGNITADGEVTAYSSSDLRLKTDIHNFSAVNMIDRLNPIQHRWNKKAKELNSNKTDDMHYGLLAQEVEQIMPELVKEMYGGKYLGLDYEQLIPVLIQGMKEQQREIEQLKKRA